MTRGNQRELAREKNLKKKGTPSNKIDDGLTVLQRKERDAQIMREKSKDTASKK